LQILFHSAYDKSMIYHPRAHIPLIVMSGILLLGILGSLLYLWMTKNQQAAAPGAVPYKVEVVANGLLVPWAITFTDTTRMVITERSGTVRVVENGKLQPSPLVTFDEVSAGSSAEKGLMGLDKDPNYEQNYYLYTCLTYESDGQVHNKVVRFTDQPGEKRQTIILDNIPAANNHVGCRVKFGPDQKLYISTGDSQKRSLAQDVNSLAGKILRINSNGSVPNDNPFKNSPIWSLGHRNPQGFDWQPGTGAMIATEHGPSSNDGPPGGDEINLVKKGSNYGWPLVSHEKTHEGTIAPLLTFTPAVAPSAGLFYRSALIPQFSGNYLFGMLAGEGLHRIVFDDKDPGKVISHEKIQGINVGRVREVIEGPDGAIYFTSSNHDGRGTARVGDDKIYRLSPR
jgi:aldose sugar dehydrogenase